MKKYRIIKRIEYNWSEEKGCNPKTLYKLQFERKFLGMIPYWWNFRKSDGYGMVTVWNDNPETLIAEARCSFFKSTEEIITYKSEL